MYIMEHVNIEWKLFVYFNKYLYQSEKILRFVMLWLVISF